MADDELLDEFEKEFKTYQGQKSRNVGGVERRVLENLAMYVGELPFFSGKTLRNKRPKTDESGNITEVNVVINLIQEDWEKVYGRITASTPQFEAFPDTRDADKMAKAEVVTSAIRAGDERLDEDYLKWQRWFWMAMGGVAFEHTPWRRNLQVSTVDKFTEDGDDLWVHHESGEELTTELRDQAIDEGRALTEHFKHATAVEEDGDYGAEIRGALTVFLPNSIKTIDDLQPGQSVQLADVRLLDWCKKTWPDADYSEIEGDDNVQILTTSISENVSFSSSSLKDLIPVIQGSPSDDDPDMVTVIERYEPVSELFPPKWSQEKGADTGPGFVVAPDPLAHGGRYSVFIPGQGVLRDGEIPYADGIPVQDFHWDVSAATFWNPDWCTKLRGLQKSISVLFSQIRQMSNARIFDPVCYDNTSLDVPKTDSPRFWPGAWQDGVPMAGRLNADQLPSWPAKQLDQMIALFHDLSGAKDLFQEKGFPGQIRGTGAVEKLHDTQDSVWGPKLRHYYKQMGKVYHRRMNRMKQFYPTSKVMRLTDPLGKVEVFEFKADDILRAGVDFYLGVEPSTILPETRRERWALMTEIMSGPLAGLYVDQRTGQPDWNAIATKVQSGSYKWREALIAQDVKFAQSVIMAIKEGRPAPPVMQFQNHAVFSEEIIGEINDDDFWKMLSQETQEALIQRLEQHQQIIAQNAEQAKQAQMDEETAATIRQAVQASTAKVQSEVTEGMLSQLREMAANDPEALRHLLSQQSEQPVTPQ